MNQWICQIWQQINSVLLWGNMNNFKNQQDACIEQLYRENDALRKALQTHMIDKPYNWYYRGYALSDLCALAETCKRQGIMPENLTRYSLNMELAYKNMRYIINEAIERSMESHLPFQYDLGGDGII